MATAWAAPLVERAVSAPSGPAFDAVGLYRTAPVGVYRPMPTGCNPVGCVRVQLPFLK